MLIYPAIHISQFGVYPDKELDAYFLEGLTAAQSKQHEAEIAQEIPLLLQDMNNIDDEALKELGYKQEEISDTGALRLRNAYQFAFKQGWIKPIRGDVFLAPAIRITHEVLDDLENAVLAAFHEMVDGLAEPSLTLHAAAQGAEPLVRVAFVRCVLSGEVVRFGPEGHMPYMFKTIDAISVEPDLDPACFNFPVVDTFAHCKTNRTMQFLPLLGHGGFKPTPSGPHPV